MFKAEYIGNISHLIGETAQCRLVEGELLVQFDNRELTLNGKHAECVEVEFAPCVNNLIGFGWHKFDKDDFVRVWDESR